MLRLGTNKHEEDEEEHVPEPSGKISSKKNVAYQMMVKRAILALSSKGGSSRKAIIKYVYVNNCVRRSRASRVTSRTIRRMLRRGFLFKTAQGRFRLTQKGKALKAGCKRRHSDVCRYKVPKRRRPKRVFQCRAPKTEPKKKKTTKVVCKYKPPSAQKRKKRSGNKRKKKPNRLNCRYKPKNKNSYKRKARKRRQRRARKTTYNYKSPKKKNLIYAPDIDEAKCIFGDKLTNICNYKAEKGKSKKYRRD